MNEQMWERVLYNFKVVSEIPRETGNEKGISDYLVGFAKKNDLEVVQDKELNVIIKKNGTEGYESSQPVIIQGHMDMVCVKDNDVDIDFSKNPIDIYFDKDRLTARGTSLGADNGIALAYAMTILESDELKHPPLEVLFTTGEEVGMDGAAVIEPEDFKGKMLINIDSEEEGKILTSCAGGITSTIKLPIKWKPAKNKYVPCLISISGLMGGHSGIEIHKGRANAIKLMGRILSSVRHNMKMRIVKVEGGSKRNAIPVEAQATVMVESPDLLEREIGGFYQIVQKEYLSADPNIKIDAAPLEKGKVKKVMTAKTANRLTALITLIPDGVQTMHRDIEGLVQSSNNVGILSIDDTQVSIVNCIRSSSASLKRDMVDRLEKLAYLTSSEVESFNDYPEWEYQKESLLRDKCVEAYESLYEKKPEITAIHAGLECGMLGARLDGLDMVSIGPDIFDAHTTRESVSVSSAKRTFEFLIKILEQIVQP